MLKSNMNTTPEAEIRRPGGQPGNANSAGNPGGLPGRSGPPGNSNAAGNPGGGAPAGNANAVSHGVYSFLSSGRLPAGAEPIAEDVNALREQLETAVAEAHQGVSLTRAALIQSIVRHETVCRLLLRYLTEQEDKLTMDQRFAVLRDVGRATDKRDAAIKALELERQEDGKAGQFAFLAIAPCKGAK
jgi:hypothetical protein